MAEYKFTAALNAADIPPISRMQPRSILIGQLDNRLRNPATSNTNNQENNPQNLPQVLYAENVVPIDGGLMSVGYQTSGGVFPGAGSADDVYTIRDATDGSWLLCPAQGYNYVKAVDSDPWVSYPTPTAPHNIAFSFAYVNGITYICYEGTFLGHWDSSIPDFVDDSGSLVGASVGNIRAICGAGNYLILLYSDGSVKWSSLTNALEFTPSTETGAGSQIPLDMRGPLVYGSPISGGFLIHCTENTVAAVYTQNSAAPWIFREVKGSGGVRNSAGTYNFANYKISKEASGQVVYMMGTHGLQALNLRDAENLHQSVSDFLTGRLYETFDTATKLLTIVEGIDLRIKVSFLVNRYLVLSYGPADSESLSYALIFDSNLKRWGKLKVAHTDIFAYNHTASNSRNNIYVLSANGQLYSVKFTEYGTSDTASIGVLMLGRYQLNRTNQICSQELELELIRDSTEVDVSVIASYDGSTVGEVQTMAEYAATDQYKCYQKQVEGVNLSYLIEGEFSLATVLLTATRGAQM